ncbi:hypothetical protein ElyMa_000416800 [Elysia marginata]|uniref:Uncharacterized protein n=1 Tax=Elysia marginata TaxID=1093978 RepID=A0AAV4FM87_9GAST|nr:hypothetical protein ElyMa_000416800 [Elysia marginata]
MPQILTSSGPPDDLPSDQTRRPDKTDAHQSHRILASRQASDNSANTRLAGRKAEQTKYLTFNTSAMDAKGLCSTQEAGKFQNLHRALYLALITNSCPYITRNSCKNLNKKRVSPIPCHHNQCARLRCWTL